MLFLVAGHAGKLVFGLLGDNDVPTVCMVGRFHFYEGFALTQTTYPIRLMSLLGVETLIGTYFLKARPLSNWCNNMLWER
jgi:purine-nucleoside phosphorylase